MKPESKTLFISDNCGIRAVALTAIAVLSLTCSTLPTLGQAHARNLNGAELPPNIPNFDGIWVRDAHNYPKPYEADQRLSPGGINPGGVIDGYNNEYLKPWVVELLLRDEKMTAEGQSLVTSHSTCYPEGTPYAYGAAQIQFLQTPDELIMIFGDQGQYRTVYLNAAHPDPVEHSWWGDSVGHFEGETFVVDTVGIAVNPQAGSMGFYGTPHTEHLHVVERWRFLEPGEPTNLPEASNSAVDAGAIDHDGRVLRLNVTVEDPIAYHKPWSVDIDYQPLDDRRVREYICEENSRSPDLAPMIARARVPDF